MGDVPLRTFVIVDIGCRLDGYCSDCTRTLATGALSEEAAAVYAVVLDAHHAAVEAVRAGVAGCAADAVARERIAAGYGEEFGHGLGHGVGLEVHEGPRLSPTSDDELRRQRGDRGARDLPERKGSACASRISWRSPRTAARC